MIYNKSAPVTKFNYNSQPCEERFTNEIQFFADHLCVYGSYTANQSDSQFSITCPRNVTSYTDYNDISAIDIFRQVLTFLGFSGDNDPSSIFYNNNQTDPRLNANQRMQNLFSESDVSSINAHYSICQSITFTRVQEAEGPTQSSFQTIYIIMIVCFGIALILFLVFGSYIVRSVKLGKYRWYCIIAKPVNLIENSSNQ
ncbi:hypothetical protein HDV06_002540 [Boothiomyces sp. JEL0866]|nr:hypothetical protein HDV06_002540 [Boothiomyces sp. JEL0866]